LREERLEAADSAAPRAGAAIPSPAIKYWPRCSVGAFALRVPAENIDVWALGSTIRFFATSSPVSGELMAAATFNQGAAEGFIILPTLSLASSWAEVLGMHGFLGIGALITPDFSSPVIDLGLGLDIHLGGATMTFDLNVISMQLLALRFALSLDRF